MTLRDDQVPRRVRKVATVLQLTLAALVVVYLASLFARDSSGYNWVFEGVIANTSLGLCGVLCLLRAWLTQRDRGAFISIGIGCLSYAVGNTAYVTYVQYLEPIPFPNVADVGYLGIYPLLIVAVLLLGRSQVDGKQGAVWLDGLVGVLGVASVGSSLVLRTTLESLSGDFGALAVGTAYPLGDLMVVSMIVGALTLRGRRPDRQWGALAGCLTIFAFADIIYLLRLSNDSYVQGTFLDALWIIGLAVLTLSAWPPARPKGDQARISDAGSLAVTIVASLLAVVVLVAASVIDVPVYAIGLSTATLVVALVRTVVAFHESFTSSKHGVKPPPTTSLVWRIGEHSPPLLIT